MAQPKCGRTRTLPHRQYETSKLKNFKELRYRMLTLKTKLKEHRICIFSLVLILIFSFFLIRHYNNRCNSFEKAIAGTEREVSKWKERENILDKEIECLKNKLSEQQVAETLLPKSNEILIHEIRQSGFNGEIKDIITDLEKHTELIPDKAILGGTMKFGDIHVISDRWVMAYIEDGHIDGYMLLCYKWDGKGFIWKVIDSYIVGE